MKRTLYMHVGMPKTGSTSIQEFCFVNQSELQKTGIYYPILPFGSKNHGEISKAFTHFLPHIDYHLCYEILYNNIYSRNDDVLLSFEGFIFDDVDHFEKIFSLFNNIYIIVYIRNFFSYFESNFSQSIKSAHYSPYTSINSSFYSNHIQRFLDKFGKNVLVEKFDDHTSKTSLIDSFLKKINILPSKNFIYPDHKNIRLKTIYSLFLKHILNIPISHICFSDCIENISNLSQNDTNAQVYSLIHKSVWDINHTKIIEQIEFEAELLKDKKWLDYSFSVKEKMISCPFTQLPAEYQHEIFWNLPAHIRHAIIESWPQAGSAHIGENLFPKIFDDSMIDELFFIFRRKLFDNYVMNYKELLHKYSYINDISNSLVGKLFKVSNHICIYSLSENHNIIPYQHIERMIYENLHLKIYVIGYDPILLLPNIIIPEQTICVIQIIGEGESDQWQLFYYTSDKQYHCEENSIIFNPSISAKNAEGAFLTLPSNALGTKIRLDPGNRAGYYYIHKFSIFVFHTNE